MRTATLLRTAMLCIVCYAGILFAAAYAMSAAVGAYGGLAIVTILALWIVQLHIRLREARNRDPLTGTASRVAFFAALEREARRCRAGRVPLSMAVLDCDSFKEVNDSLGHVVGDAVLVQAANVLKERMGSRGIVARLWGDAFCILIPERSFENVREQLEDLKRALDSRMAAHDWPVTFSIGSATFADLPSDPHELVAVADSLMRSVKRRGRNNLACRLMTPASTAGQNESASHSNQKEGDGTLAATAAGNRH
jgi:diguanylate cyclase (GGDEF)-like protein